MKSTCLQNTSIFGMNTCTTEHLSVHFFTVITNFTSSIETIYAINRSTFSLNKKNTIITSRYNSFVFDNNGAYSLFKTSRPLFKYITYRKEVFIKSRSVGWYDLFVMFLIDLNKKILLIICSYEMFSLALSMINLTLGRDLRMKLRYHFFRKINYIVINSKEIF